MILFGITNSAADYYVNICPGLGYVSTDVRLFVEWFENEPGDFQDHPMSHIGNTQAGMKFPLKMGQELGLMRMIRCYVPTFTGGRGEAGIAAEQWFATQHPGCQVVKADLALEYKDVDFVIDEKRYQVKLDNGIARFGNVYLELAKDGVHKWSELDQKKPVYFMSGGRKCYV